MTGYTPGVFDMFHIGHLHLLQRARSQCDRLIVGVTTDELCILSKGKAPIIPFEDRVEILSSLSCVDEVVPQTSHDKLEAWERICFDRIFVGDDWQGSDRWNDLEPRFSAVGVEVVYFSYTPYVNSSLLREVLTTIHGEVLGDG